MTLATISNQIKELKELVLSQKTHKMLSAEETAGRLDVSVKYLYKLTSGNRIPFYKPNGKKIYFDEVDVDKYLRRKRAFTKEELESNS